MDSTKPNADGLVIYFRANERSVTGFRFDASGCGSHGEFNVEHSDDLDEEKAVTFTLFDHQIRPWHADLMARYPATSAPHDMAQVCAYIGRTSRVLVHTRLSRDDWFRPLFLVEDELDKTILNSELRGRFGAPFEALRQVSNCAVTSAEGEWVVDTAQPHLAEIIFNGEAELAKCWVIAENPFNFGYVTSAKHLKALKIPDGHDALTVSDGNGGLKCVLVRAENQLVNVKDLGPGADEFDRSWKYLAPRHR